VIKIGAQKSRIAFSDRNSAFSKRADDSLFIVFAEFGG
jgi:hypothetical protein